jgi:hypothetical protein
LFSNARWSGDALGLVLADLIVARLLPAGAALTIAVDDTLFKRSGKKVFGVSRPPRKKPEPSSQPGRQPEHDQQNCETRDEVADENKREDARGRRCGRTWARCLFVGGRGEVEAGITRAAALLSEQATSRRPPP